MIRAGAAAKKEIKRPSMKELMRIGQAFLNPDSSEKLTLADPFPSTRGN
jgi:hypothetical protein